MHSVSQSIDSELINKLIKNVESNRLKKAFNVRLVIARRQPSRLESILSHASFTSIPRVFKTTDNFECS